MKTGCHLVRLEAESGIGYKLEVDIGVLFNWRLMELSAHWSIFTTKHPGGPELRRRSIISFHHLKCIDWLACRSKHKEADAYTQIIVYFKRWEGLSQGEFFS